MAGVRCCWTGLLHSTEGHTTVLSVPNSCTRNYAVPNIATVVIVFINLYSILCACRASWDTRTTSQIHRVTHVFTKAGTLACRHTVYTCSCEVGYNQLIKSHCCCVHSVLFQGGYTRLHHVHYTHDLVQRCDAFVSTARVAKNAELNAL